MRQVGLDARGQQLVNETPVEVQAGLVHRPVPWGRTRDQATLKR